MRLIGLGLIRAYQVLTVWMPPTCRYTPSCSAYAVQALRQYGAVKGTILAVWRVLRCNPWGGHGHDPPRWFGESLPEDLPDSATDSEPRADDASTLASPCSQATELRRTRAVRPRPRGAEELARCIALLRVPL